MMNIGIITWHSIPNHGGMLQMLALTKIFSELQLESKVVLHDIVFEEHHQKRNLRKYATIAYWEGFINNRLGRQFNSKKDALMIDFQENTFSLVKPSTQLNAICIGSDEVFSLTNGFTPEFFGEGFCIPVFSYAGSFGQTSISVIHEKKLFQRLKTDFSKFEGISVRDENSLCILKKLGFDNAIQNIDPVLLYGYKRETQIASSQLKSQVLLYSYDGNMNTWYERNAIKRFARNSKCSILSAGFYHFWADKNEIFTPIGILKEFVESKYIVTDTFHGVVLSIISHAQFAVLVRKTNSNKITSLLKSLGLENRLLNNINDINEIIKEPIDYTEVENKLDYLRKESMEYLKICIERVKKHE